MDVTDGDGIGGGDPGPGAGGSAGGGSGSVSDGFTPTTFIPTASYEPNFYPDRLTAKLKRFAPHQPRIDHHLYYEGEGCDLLEVSYSMKYCNSIYLYTIQ